MHPYQYLSLREPQAQDFFLEGSRSLKALPVGIPMLCAVVWPVNQAVKRQVRDQRGHMARESRALIGCRRTGLLQPMRIETCASVNNCWACKVALGFYSP